MAKASPIEAIDAQTPLAEAARRVLGARLLDVRRYEPAVLLQRDADAVHDMRVATRRLRAAIGMFRRGDTLDEAAVEVKSLGRALGYVRDLDVQLEWLAEGLAGELGDRERIGVQRLADDRRRLYDEPVRRLEQSVTRFAADVAPAVARAIARVAGRGRFGGRRLRQPVVRRLRQVARAAEEVLASPDPHTAHELRIVVKKLRYQAELLGLALPIHVAPLLEALAPLQALLGDLHTPTSARRCSSARS